MAAPSGRNVTYLKSISNRKSAFNLFKSIFNLIEENNLKREKVTEEPKQDDIAIQHQLDKRNSTEMDFFMTPKAPVDQSIFSEDKRGSVKNMTPECQGNNAGGLDFRDQMHSAEKSTPDSQRCPDKKENPDDPTDSRTRTSHFPIESGKNTVLGSLGKHEKQFTPPDQLDPEDDLTTEMNKLVKKAQNLVKLSSEEIKNILPEVEAEASGQCSPSEHVSGKDYFFKEPDTPEHLLDFLFMPSYMPHVPVSIPVYMFHQKGQPPRHEDRPDFNFALVRLTTFWNFPYDAERFATNLADKGFTYKGTGDDYVVECWFCKLQISVEGMRSLDRVHKIHRSSSPNCSMVCGYVSGHIPPSLHSHDDSQELGAAGACKHAETEALEADTEIANVVDKREQQATIADLGISKKEPKHPNEASFLKRRETLDSPYVKDHPVNKDHLARAGFFCAGAGRRNPNTVHCFFCGVGISQWNIGDNAWIKHAMMSPQCLFLIFKTGQLFVTVVSELHQQQIRLDEDLVIRNLKRKREASIDAEASVDAAVVELFKLEDPAITAALHKYEFQSIRPQAVRHCQSNERSEDIALGIRRAHGDAGQENVDAHTNAEQAVGIGAVATTNDELRRQQLCRCLKEKCILNLPCCHCTDCADCTFVTKKCCRCKACIKARCKVGLV